MASNNNQSLSSFQFPSSPKRYIPERDIIHVLLENGENYIFKPDRPEDYEREGHSAHAEMSVYEKFKHLQGTCIPICYGVVTLHDNVGLLLEDCGRRSFGFPLNDDEISKFILYVRATCVVQKYLSSGLIHPDMTFRNIVYDPNALQVRIIDIEPVQYTDCILPQDIWRDMDIRFLDFFGYGKPATRFSWGLSSVFRVLKTRPWNRDLLLLLLQFCLCLLKKKLTMRKEGRFSIDPPESLLIPISS